MPVDVHPNSDGRSGKDAVKPAPRVGTSMGGVEKNDVNGRENESVMVRVVGLREAGLFESIPNDHSTQAVGDKD